MTGGSDLKVARSFYLSRFSAGQTFAIRKEEGEFLPENGS